GVTYADGLNYGGYLRAKLTVSGAADYVEYVYAEGNNPFPNGKPDDLDVSDAANKIKPDQYSADLTLAFTRGNDNVTTVVDAASYTVTIQGKGSCAFGAGNDSAALTVHKKTLSVSQANFEHWKLYFGNEADKTYVTGADETATDGIVEGDGSTKYVADNKLQTMESGANYVWYRNTGMRMVLDGTTAVTSATTKADGATSEYLMDYLRLAEIAVSNSVFVPSVTSGETSVAGTWDPAESVLHPGINEYTRYKTTVTVTYNANYTVTGITPAASGESVITVTVEWAAVTKPNSITAQGGTASDNALAWVYGDHTAPQFATESGDTVIFTFTHSESAAETTVRFAQVHNGSSNVYYEVKEVDSQYVADTDKRLTVGYYADYLNRLAAGTCVMTVSAPDYVGEKSVVAYGIPQTYTIAVSPRKLTDRDETPIRLLQLRVPYNGEENNTPEIELALQVNGHVFVEGVDYELVSSRVEVGVANRTLGGIGSGSYTHSEPTR
ncbi:MAG: hypothetical protein K2L51_01585, partial [Clostridiales bacterium]|nr:hypothetical protein [Clostridiales bacterium]